MGSSSGGTVGAGRECAMTRILIHRLFVLSLRLAGVAAILVVLLEVGFGWLREESIHVWNASLSSPLPLDFSPEGSDPVLYVWEAFLRSLPALVISFLGIWLIGYGWGVLGARFRKAGVAWFLRFPFAVGACFPGFWIVILVALYSYLVWERPGFADEIRVDRGPDLVRWWNATVISVPLILVGASRLLKGVGEVLKEQFGRLDRGALFLLGKSSEDIFYRRVFRPSVKNLVGLMDQAVPLTLGGLVIVETAFHHDGIGSACIEGIREGEVSVVFLSAFFLAMLAGVFTWLRECIVCSMERREG